MRGLRILVMAVMVTNFQTTNHMPKIEEPRALRR